MEKIEIKMLLAEKCNNYIAQRISGLQYELREAQDAANEVTSSSAGDKYNTDRALMHIERDKYAVQLADAQLLAKTMDMVHVNKKSAFVELGSLVETNNGNYFIAVGVGKVDFEEYSAFAVSLASPIGQQLKGKKAKDTFILNNKNFTILNVW